MTLLVHLGWKVIELFWRRNRSQSSIHHRREREQNCTHSTPAKGEERKKNQIKSTRLLAPSLLWRVLFLIFPDRIQSSLDQSCFNFPPAPRPLSGDTRAPQAAGRAALGRPTARSSARRNPWMFIPLDFIWLPTNETISSFTQVASDFIPAESSQRPIYLFEGGGGGGWNNFFFVDYYSAGIKAGGEWK